MLNWKAEHRVSNDLSENSLRIYPPRLIRYESGIGLRHRERYSNGPMIKKSSLTASINKSHSRIISWEGTSRYMSSSKNGLKGISKPGELLANCFIVIILQILSWNSECSTIFVLQIGQVILGFKLRWLYLSINKVIRILRISFLCTSRPIPNHKMKQTSLKYTSLLSKSIK